MRMRNRKHHLIPPHIMIIDCHAICHYVKYSLSRLNHEGEGTGIIYGFLSQLFYIQKRLRCNQWVFAWDSQNSKRKEIRPGYKEKDKKLSQEEIDINKILYKQFDLLRKRILPRLGFKNNFITDGLEADDIIASICSNNKKQKKTIVSRDNDLWQLLSPTCDIYDFQKKSRFGVSEFEDGYGIRPRQWGLVKAIAGCTSDKVVGIKGVGNTTAVKYIKKELKTDSKAHQNIVKGLKIIEDNKPFVILPFSGTPKYKIQQNHLKKIRMHNMCQKYGMENLLSMLDEWVKVFKIKK